MSKYNKLIFLIILGMAILLSACGSPATATPYPSELPWEEAVKLLTTGEVDWVAQTHSLEVTFYLKDGQEIHTVEPNIDDIFHEIDLCGAPCSDIALATE